MKTIKIIDILCYISTGDYDKLPEEFEYAGYVWHWCIACKIYETKDEDKNEMNLYKYFATEGDLNDEVVILDEEDEFEDIVVLVERLCLDHDEITPIERATRNQVNENRDMITQLIKNQKLIINKLKEEGK